MKCSGYEVEFLDIGEEWLLFAGDSSDEMPFPIIGGDIIFKACKKGTQNVVTRCFTIKKLLYSPLVKSLRVIVKDVPEYNV